MNYQNIKETKVLKASKKGNINLAIKYIIWLTINTEEL